MSLKKNIWGISSISAAVVLLAATGCSNGAGGEVEPSEDDPIQVVATIAQIGEPLERIGGDFVEVKTIMGPGVDPHLYEASQSDLQTIGNADVIFYNGLHLEAQMSDVFANVDVPALAIGEEVAESKLLDDEEDASATDPHIWFDVNMWQQAIDAAVEQLKEIAPSEADYFEQNKQDYFAELDELYTFSVEKLGEIPEEQRILVTAHDAFQYFGRMNNIEVVGLQGLSTEDEVGISDIQSTIDTIVEKQVPAVFVESSVNDSSIQAVIEGAGEAGVDIELGGTLYSDAMGEAGTEEGTYIGMYRHNVETIYDALMNGGGQD
ncbi:zinc ABC transporter substrate-binding protein [Alkalihalobacillus clausii]|jgi:manganese/zinc/iron transport system substrate-binding protein|uniref:metal ABC transporter solute-binding protein, Zn/Mn family n=1 Tax=Shouchella clausii TaxID=79880 RepID=UPI00203ADBD7|nr:zinc ABC transporter substrate-binding protein [Shouchella clausii]MCM3547953.1 zinc ABC transporter substrate-binding protein [Shouchella clausii]